MQTRVAIIGTGFAGLGMAIRLKQEGVDDFVVLERAEDVGGTWRDNSYPGCQCDVPSHLYSLSFATNPDWSRTYSPQPEIWDYLRRCAHEHGVMPHIRFGHAVTGAAWDDEARTWRIETSRGPVTARVLIAGNGPLSEPQIPDLPGADSFEGAVFHSAQWDHEHDLAGERVAVIGTGASAIQFVPRIQPEVEKLHVFQRTPPWIVPHTDRPITRVERWLYRRFPALQRLLRGAIYWSRETLVLGFSVNQRLMAVPERLARAHLARQVPDPELRRKLTPDYRIGCKRILLSNDWYPALTKPNVELVTDGIREIRPRSVITADGTEREVDTIIYGTGFKVTDPPAAEHIRRADGRSLAEVWQGSPQTYLGTSVARFPNLFFLIGPNTGLGHNSMVFMIESQLTYILDCLRTMERDRVAAVAVRPEVQAAYNRELQAVLPRTVWNSGCKSWYLDATGRNTTVWPDFTWKFRQRTRRFDPASYVLEPASEPAVEPVAA
jgi:cation diffusion facilitator CzcD-associated flavoprotein CzcO